MPAYRCRHCKKTFEAAERWCPTCLTASGVEDPAAAEEAPPARDNFRFLRGPGILVTIAILVPTMVVLRWGRTWWQTFLIAMVAFGAGHAVDYLVDRARQKSRGK